MRKGLCTIVAALTAGALFMSSNLQAQANSSPFWSTEGNNNVDNASKLGTTNAIPLRIFTNDQLRAYISTGGNFGIGTSGPAQRFHVEGEGNQAIFVNTDALSAISGSGQIGYAKALPTGANQRLGYFLVGSRGGAQLNLNTAGMSGFSSGVWSASSRPTYLTFETTPSGATSREERMRIEAGGNVGIGTTNPQYLLDVANRIRLRSGSSGSAGLWLNNTDNSDVIGFMGVTDDSHIGLWGNTGAGWSLIMNTTTGEVDLAGNLDVNGTQINLGTAEAFSDAGLNTIGSNSDIVPTFDGSFTLGQSGLRWSSVWAVDGTINTSDAREKTNIKDLNYGLKEIMKLHSTRFNWKNKTDEGDKLGLIAQELQKVLPEVVRDWEYKKDEKSGAVTKVPSARLGVAYSDIIPVLIKGMQEQQQMIEQQQQQIDDLKAMVNKMANGNSLSRSLTSASIGLVTPNPVNGSASIRYSIPDGSNGQLLVSDAAGRQVKAISLKGAGTLNLDASSLASGVYHYSLFVDGKKTQTEKMTVVR